MSPQIYEVTTTTGRMAWLVDSTRAFLARDERGKIREHFSAAIELGALRAGELIATTHPETGVRTIHGPRCCVLCKAKARHIPDIRARGFDMQAARVLLDLAAALNNVTNKTESRKWEFHAPAEKGALQPWDDLKFLAAWRWSYWKRENLTGLQRHADMAALGYEGTQEALRRMVQRMGLAKPQNRKE